jgi:hypothetical protein
MIATFLRATGFAAALATSSSIVHGQGTVSFRTGPNIYIATNSVRGGPSTGLTWPSSFASNAYYYALLVAPTNQTTVDVTFAGWTFTGNYATNRTAGYVYGDYGSDPSVIVPGYYPGDAANFVVVGWSSNVGHNWNIVAPLFESGAIAGLGFSGISQVGVGLVLAGGGTPPATVFGAPPQQIPGFTLNAPIPEPSFGPLLVLGAVAARVLRRR